MKENRYVYKEAKTSFGQIDKRQHELVTHVEFNKYINEFLTQGNHQDDALVEMYGVASDHETRLETAEDTLINHTQQLVDHEMRVTQAEGTLVNHENRITQNTDTNNAQSEVINNLNERLKVVEDNNADFKVVTVFANNVQKVESFVATQGQTLFTLQLASYIPGQNRLAVYVDGVQQTINDGFVELDSRNFKFTEGLQAGMKVTAHYFTEEASDDLTDIMETIKEGPAILDELIQKGEKIKADSILVQDTEPLPEDNCDIWFDTSEDDLVSVEDVAIKSLEAAAIVTSLALVDNHVKRESQRIDNLARLAEGSTTGDAELIDIRVGYDGMVYPNSGSAVREQIRQVASRFEQSINQLHLDNLTREHILNHGNGVLEPSTGWVTTDFIEVPKGEYVFVYKSNGKYIYGSMCIWSAYDSNKTFIIGGGTNADGTNFINLTDTRIAYLRASFGNARLTVEPMIVPKSSFSTLAHYVAPIKGNVLKDTPYITNTDLAPLQTQLSTMTNAVQHIEDQFTYSTNVLLLDNLIAEYEINPSTGELRSAAGWRATDFMPLRSNDYIFVYKSNGKYIYGASCFWAVYDSNKQYITGGVTNADGSAFINALDERVAYIRASFYNTRLQAEPMIVPKTYYAELKDYLPPFKGVLLKDSPYLTECNSTFETDIRKRRIVAPKNVAVVYGNQLDVHYDNVLLGADARLMPYKNVYGSAPTVHMRDMFRIDSLQTTGTTKANIRILNEGYVDYEQPLGDLMLQKDLYIIPVSQTAGSGLSRNVMFIGDSITAYGLYPKEVVNLFTNDTLKVNLVGTLGDKSGLHEGRGGWTSQHYCQVSSFNGSTNAFYNPTTKTFDFAYYMKTNGYSSVDDVFINLGINDMAQNLGIETIIGYYNQMINSIRAYNSNIKIFIGLCILPYSGNYSTVNNYTQFMKAQRLALHERLIKEYDEREDEGIYVVPFNLTIDTEHDFKFEERPLSHRNSTLVKYCTDVTHPSLVAYNKMADMCAWYIKYAL